MIKPKYNDKKTIFLLNQEDIQSLLEGKTTKVLDTLSAMIKEGADPPRMMTIIQLIAALYHAQPRKSVKILPCPHCNKELPPINLPPEHHYRDLRMLLETIPLNGLVPETPVAGLVEIPFKKPESVLQEHRIVARILSGETKNDDGPRGGA